MSATGTTVHSRTTCGALVIPSPKGFPVRLINPSSDSVVLHKHTSVATIEPIVGTPICPVSTTKPDQCKNPISPSKQAMLHKLAEGHLSRDQRHALESVFVAYADVFAETSEDVGRTSMTQHQSANKPAASLQLDVNKRSPWSTRCSRKIPFNRPTVHGHHPLYWSRRRTGH